MSTSSTLTAALLLALLAPAAASAQATPNPTPTYQSSFSNRPTVVFFANGGGNSALTNLNDAGTASLSTGWTAGGGVGLQLNRFVALRGTFDFARTEGEGSALGALNGRRLNRYFYGGDVQLRYPNSSGFAPYLLLGAGAVTIDGSDDVGIESFTKFAGKGGLGIEYQLRNNVGLFAQGATYVYDYDRGGFDKTQWDLLWTAGLSYRLPR
jgi:opacity protein-like surface antigen